MLAGEAFVLSAEGKEALRTRLQAESAEVAMDVDGIGMLRLSGENRALLDNVVVEQLRGTPMAPLTMDAPRLAVVHEERFESIEDDLVAFRSRSVRGSGRGFRASTEVGSLRFEGGADVTLDLGDGRLASIATSGAPSLLSIDEIPRSEEMVAPSARGACASWRAATCTWSSASPTRDPRETSPAVR